MLLRNPVLAALLAATSLLAACDDVEQAFDCVDDDRVQFDTSTLPDPVLNETYEAVITARISNEPDDGDFTYTFNLAGDLPPGIGSRVDGRRFFLEGAATATGTYMPTLNVQVTDGGGEFGDGGDAGDLCRTSRTVTYTLVVAEP